MRKGSLPFALVVSIPFAGESRNFSRPVPPGPFDRKSKRCDEAPVYLEAFHTQRGYF